MPTCAPKCVLLSLLVAVSAMAPVATAQQPMEVAFADPQPHFVAAWAPKKPHEAERAAVLTQRASLELTGVTVDAALKALTNQLRLRITYSPAIVPNDKRVTIRAGDVAVVTALTEILFGSGLDVVVARDGALALVRCEHSRPKRGAVVPARDSGVIVGTVTDKASGQAIAGATVSVDGTDKRATTDYEGRYRIGGLAAGALTLRARFIGYAPLERSVSLDTTGRAVADFMMIKSAQRLDEVVTTGTVVPTEVRASPTPVSVITDSEITLQRPHTIQELFRQAVPGAVSWDMPSFPYYTPFSTRGASTLAGNVAQMKVLIDGIETAVASVSGLDPTSIERVEVVRGPQAAAIYGSEAIGGVVQFFTKRGDPNLSRPQVTLEASVGLIQTPYEGFDPVARQTYMASIRGAGAGVSYNLGGGYSRTADWIPNGELSRQSTPSLYGGIRYSRGAISIDLSGRYYTRNYGTVGNPALAETGLGYFARPFYLPQQTQNQTISVQLRVAPTQWWQHALTMGLDRYGLSYEQTQPRLTTPTDTLLQVLNQFQSKAAIRYTTTLQTAPGTPISASLTSGIDHWSLPASTWFALGAFNTTGTIRTAPGQPISASRVITNNTGYFAQAQLGIRDALYITGGVRAENNSNYGDSLGTPISPRVGLSFVQPIGRATVKLRGSWGRAIRSPAPGNKFEGVSALERRLASPTLGPERQEGWDAGVDVVAGDRATLGVTYYAQTAKDLIELVNLDVQASPPVTQFQNIGRVRNTGLEVEARVSFRLATLRGGYGYARSRIAQLQPGYTGDLQIGDQTLLTPKHTANASLAVFPVKGTTIATGLTYVGSWNNYDNLLMFSCFGGTRPCPPSFPASARGFIVAYPALMKVNATLSQQFGSSITAFLSVDNLTDNRAYEADNLFPVMGRTTTIGLQFRR